MARVLALIPDLLFGSKVQASLTAAGHEVELAGDEDVRDRIDGADLLIVDLTDQELDGAALVRSLRAEGALEGVATLGFFAHVDVEARERAVAAGFDLVVPRSRMAREGQELAGALLARP